MSDDSTTQCLLFPDIFRKSVVAQFDQRKGSSDGGAVLLKASAQVRARLAQERAADLMPLIEEIRQQGVTSLRAIAVELNRRSIPATRGGEWTAVQVQRTLIAVGSDK